MNYIKNYQDFQDKIVENNQWKMTEKTRKYYDMLSNHLKSEFGASPQDIKEKFAEMADKFEDLGNDSQGNPIADGFWKNNKHIIEKYDKITELIENAYSFFRVVSQNAHFRG